jgi:glycosyltransferase involved in cell wall biosynthesis
MSHASKPSVTVVVPVHNEASFLPDAEADITVLIAENGSTDTTGDLVKQAMEAHPTLKLLELDEPNYGAAMRDGFLASDTDWVANFDIDYFSGPFLTEALSLSDEADIVLASKRVEGSNDQRGLVRRLATWTFNFILRPLLTTLLRV